MKLLEILRSDYKRLRDGEPGQRFRRYVDYRRQRRGSGFRWTRLANFVAGVSLMVLGLGIGWLPGPGGFVALIGLALLASEIPWVATIMDGAERAIRRVWHSVRGRAPASGAGDREPPV